MDNNRENDQSSSSVNVPRSHTRDTIRDQSHATPGSLNTATVVGKSVLPGTSFIPVEITALSGEESYGLFSPTRPNQSGNEFFGEGSNYTPPSATLRQRGRGSSIHDSIDHLSPDAANSGFLGTDPEEQGGDGGDGHLQFIDDTGSNAGDDDSTSPSDGQSPWARRWQYLSYYIPVTRWLPKYKWRETFLLDLFAGLSVGAMLTPQSMAYVSILKLPPIHGLISALFAAVIYFILGHSQILSLGPEATTSILLSELVYGLSEVKEAIEAGEDEMPIVISAAMAISLLTGIITLIFGILRLGFVDGIFSRPILAGFVCAVGATLMTDQSIKVLGLKSCTTCHGMLDKIAYLIDEVFIQHHVKWQTATIGFGCVLFLAIFKFLRTRFPKSKILPRIPHIFVMVIFVTLLSYLFKFEKYGVKVIGAENSSFPTPAVPRISKTMFSEYLPAAVILAVLGFVKTQLVNKTITVPGTTISPNRELIALGTVHIITSFFGGYASFGSLPRTRVSANAGTQSQVSHMVAALVVLISIVALMPFFAYMPEAVTGGIIWFVAFGLIDISEALFAYKTEQWVDLALFIGMTATTYFMGIDIGLFFAFGMCLLLVVKQQHKPSVRLLGRLNVNDQAVPRIEHADGFDADPTFSTPDGGHSTTGGDALASPLLNRRPSTSSAASTSSVTVPDEAYYEISDTASLHTAQLEGILIYQIDGPLFFCNSVNLKERTRRIELYGSVVSHPSQPAHPLALRAIIFDVAAVTSVDSTAASVLLEIVQDYQSRHVRVMFVKLRKSLMPLFIKSGIYDLVGGVNIRRTIAAAVAEIEAQEAMESLTNTSYDHQNLSIVN